MDMGPLGYIPPPVPTKTITVALCKFCGARQDINNQPSSCPQCGAKDVVVKTLEVDLSGRLAFSYDPRRKGPI